MIDILPTSEYHDYWAMKGKKKKKEQTALLVITSTYFCVSS